MKKLIIFFIVVLAISLNAQEKIKPEQPKPLPRYPVIEHEGHSLCFSDPHEQSAWVSYHLTKKKLGGDAEIKRPKFKPDPKTLSMETKRRDYKKEIYLPGMLAPVSHFKYSEEALKNMYYMSNVSPMKTGFYNKVWKRVENHLTLWTKEYGGLYIAMGPLLNEPPYGTIKETPTIIPKNFFVAILSEDKSKAVGFLLANEYKVNPLYNFAMPIDKLEKETELDFFFNLKDETEDKVESKYIKENWVWPEK